MKELKKMIKDINDGKNLEVNLPAYLNITSSVLSDYSSIQLALEYYGLKEYIEDEILNNSDTYEEVKKTVESLNALVAMTIEAENISEIREEALRLLDDLRNDVMGKMDVLTMYTDTFRTYEYVLNRLELNYVDQFEEIDEALFTSKLETYLFGSKDNVVINSRIQEMLGQLPIRMVKNKFFDYIKASFDRYKDSDEESLNTYEYMLRTNAMLYTPEASDTEFKNLAEVKKQLEEADYTNLDHETYKKLCTLLMDISVYINMVSDSYLFVQKVINSLYVYLLTIPYAMEQNEKMQGLCKEITKILHNSFTQQLSEEDSDRLAILLDQTMGHQEASYEKYMALEPTMALIKEQYQDMMEAFAIDKQFACLFLCEKLCSNSVFIDIHKEAEVKAITEDKIVEVTQTFIGELTDFFSAHPQCINRAVMANVLSTMPVFFQNTKEVMEFASASLERCSNVKEKTVAMRLLLEAMEEDEFM